MALLIALAGAAPGWAIPVSDTDPGRPTSGLAVETIESRETVRLEVRLPAAVEPESVEVQLMGRTIVVRARSRDGEELRSPVVVVDEAPSGEGVQADYDGSGRLIVTLQKKPPAL